MTAANLVSDHGLTLGATALFFFLVGYWMGWRQRHARSEPVQAVAMPKTHRAQLVVSTASRSSTSVTTKGEPSAMPRADVMQTLVNRIANRCGAGSAVVADAMGFVVVGTGANVEALGAFGALVRELGERAQELLPMGGLQRLTICDDKQMIVIAQKIATEKSELIFASLGKAADAEKVDLSELIAKSPTIAF